MEKNSFSLEDVHLEYKKSSQNRIPTSMWDTVSAFANTDGGYLILGADENLSTKEITITGIDDPNTFITNILNAQKANNQISSPMIVEKNISIFKHNDSKSLVKIYIPKNTKNRPIYLLGNLFENTFIREKDSDRHASKEEILLMLRDSSDAIDSAMLENVLVDDLVLTDIAKFKSTIATIQDDPRVADLNSLEFLQNLGLASKDFSSSEKKIKITKAALLLFGKYSTITYFFPHFFLDFTVQKDQSNHDFIDRVYTTDGSGKINNIFSFFEAVWGKLNALITSKFELKNDMARKDSNEVILRSLREALVNTLVHADYMSQEQTKITAFPEYIQFKNPGEMRVSTEDFARGGTSIARNPKLFNAFLIGKLGEHTGSGGRRMFSIAKKLEFKDPDINTNIKRTELKIWTTPDIESFINSLNPEWRPAYSAFKEHLIISFSDVKDFYKNDYQARKALTEMIKAGLIFKKGKGKGTKYYVSKTSPISRRATVEFIDSMNDVLYHKG